MVEGEREREGKKTWVSGSWWGPWEGEKVTTMLGRAWDPKGESCCASQDEWGRVSGNGPCSNNWVLHLSRDDGNSFRVLYLQLVCWGHNGPIGDKRVCLHDPFMTRMRKDPAVRAYTWKLGEDKIFGASTDKWWWWGPGNLTLKHNPQKWYPQWLSLSFHAMQKESLKCQFHENRWIHTWETVRVLWTISSINPFLLLILGEGKIT